MRVLVFIFCITSIYAQENCSNDVSKSAKKHFTKAKRYIQNYNYSKSIDFLKNAIEEQSDYSDAYYLLANIYEKKGNKTKAQIYFEKTIEYCPMYSANTYWSLATISFENKSYEKAIAYFKNFLKFLNTEEAQKQQARKQLKVASFLHDIYSNPVPYDPKPVEGISTENDEYLCALTMDNETCYFTRRYKKQVVGMLREKTVEEFSISHKKDGHFESAQKMPYPFNARDNEGGPCLSIDNRELFFTICDKENGYRNCDIYYSYKKYENWSELERLKFPVNGPKSWESQPTISSDGKTLIFSSSRPGGVGGADLYSVTKDENGQWGNLKSLPVNTTGDEKSPFLHPDSETLYFSSDTHLGLGGLDIFYCKKDSSGNWSTPTNIGYPINTENDDLAFFVSSDGKTAYFSSNKLDGLGGWDLYQFSLYKAARPEKIFFLKGDVKGEFDELLYDAIVEVKSVKTNEVQRLNVNQENGQYVGIVTVDEDEDLLVTAKSKDYVFNSTYFTANEISSFAQVRDFKMQAIEEDKSFVINNIYFDSDSYFLNDQARQVLNGFIEFMTINRNIIVSIHGYTDNVGSSASNLELSTNRAKSVYEFLLAMGISSERLSYKGFGEAKPLVPNDIEENRAINRRTEFYIVKK